MVQQPADDHYADYGRGDDALQSFVPEMKRMPQLTPPGQVLGYNNAAICAAGRVIEVVTGKPYEMALKELVLDPLGLKHSGFFTDELIGQNIAASHAVEKDRPVVTETWAFPRSLASTGGLISSAREQLARWRPALDAPVLKSDRAIHPDGQQLIDRCPVMAHRRGRDSPRHSSAERGEADVPRSRTACLL